MAWFPHGRQHVIGLERGGQALGLPQGGGGFVVAARLGEHGGGKRVHLREEAAVAGGVQRRGRLGDVLTDDRHVADLPITLPEAEMRQANRAGIVCALGLLERPAVQGDGARLFSARECHAAVRTPEI